MQTTALLTVLVIVLILAAAGPSLLAKSKGGAEPFDAGNGWSRYQASQELSRLENMPPSSLPGYGAQRQNPYTTTQSAEGIRQRNGIMSPEALTRAEQSAWAPSNPNAAAEYDVTQGHYPGHDFAQQSGNQQDGSWSETVRQIAVDPRTAEQHSKWVNEVAPFSQGAFSVDNSDEMVAMSLPRHGITAFRSNAPVQGPNSLFVTEAGPALVAEHYKKFNFNG